MLVKDGDERPWLGQSWSCCMVLFQEADLRYWWKILAQRWSWPKTSIKDLELSFLQRCWSKMLGKDLGQWPWSKILGQDVGPRCCSRSWSVTLTKNADQWPLSQTPKALIQAVGPRCCSTSWPVALITNANHWPRPKMAKVLIQEEVLAKDFGQRCWSRMLVKDGDERPWLGQSWSCCMALVQEVSQRYWWKIVAQRWPWPKASTKDLELRSSSKMLIKDVGERPWPMTLIKDLGQDVGPRCCSRSWSVTLTKNADQWPWPKTPKALIQGVGPSCCSTSWPVALITNANHWSRPKMAKVLAQEEMLVKDSGQKIDPGCWSKMVMKDLGLAKAGLVAWPCSKRLVKDTGERFLPKDDLGPRPQSKIWNQDFPQRCWGKTLANDLDQKSWGKMLAQGVVQGLGQWPWPKMLISDLGQRHQRHWPKALVQSVVQHLDQWPWSQMQAIDLGQRWPRPWSKRRCWTKVLAKGVGPGCWSKMVMKGLGLAKAGLLHDLGPRD